MSGTMLTESQKLMVGMRVVPDERFTKPMEVERWQGTWDTLVGLATEYSDHGSDLFKYINNNDEPDVVQRATKFIVGLQGVRVDEAKEALIRMKSGVIFEQGGERRMVPFGTALQSFAVELQKPDEERDWEWAYKLVEKHGGFREVQEEVRKRGNMRLGWLVPMAAILTACSGFSSPYVVAEVNTPQPVEAGSETTGYNVRTDVVYQDSGGGIKRVVDGDRRNSCGVVVTYPDTRVMVIDYDNPTYAVIVEDLGYEVQGRSPDVIEDVDDICSRHGVALGKPGYFYFSEATPEPTARPVETPLPTVAFTSEPEKSILTEKQMGIYKEIVDIYGRHGVKYFFPPEYFADGVRPEGSQREDPGSVVLEIPANYSEEARMVLKVGYAMLGEKGTEFLRKVVVAEYCACLWDQQTISINSDIKSFDYTWKRTMPIHELIHLVDPVFSKFLYTSEEALELEKTKADLLYHFEPISVYSDLYANPNGEAWGNNPYYRLGDYIYMNRGNYPDDETSPIWMGVMKKMEEYEFDGFSEYDRVRVGRLVFEAKRDNPEFVLPGDLDQLFANDYYLQLTYEGFAELMTQILNGSGSKYTTDPVAIKLAEQYMRVVRGDLVDIAVLKRDLRSLEFELPFQLVESDVKK